MQSREQKREQKLKALQDDLEREAYVIRQCFTGEKGKEALKILCKLFYDRPSYARGDQYHTAFREGQRDVCGYINQAMEERQT